MNKHRIYRPFTLQFSDHPASYIAVNRGLFYIAAVMIICSLLLGCLTTQTQQSTFQSLPILPPVPMSSGNLIPVAPYTNVAFAVYSGPASEQYTASVLTTNRSFRLASGKFAVVAAVDQHGIESDFSREVQYTAPATVTWGESHLVLGCIVESSSTVDGPFVADYATNFITLTNQGESVRLFRLRTTLQ